MQKYCVTFFGKLLLTTTRRLLVLQRKYIMFDRVQNMPLQGGHVLENLEQFKDPVSNMQISNFWGVKMPAQIKKGAL